MGEVGLKVWTLTQPQGFSSECLGAFLPFCAALYAQTVHRDYPKDGSLEL